MSRYVERFTTGERVLHWVVAIAFFVLVFSGLGLFAHTFFGYFDFFGGPQQGIFTHKIAGLLFFGCSVFLFLLHRQETSTFDADDQRWFSSWGGYLSREKHDIPQGKFNAGQKLFSLFAIVATVIMGLTGVIIWEPTAFGRGLTQFALMLHGLFFTLFIIGAIVHIYLASIGNPGTLEGMLWGQVRRIWAKKHASKWYEAIAKEK